MALKETLTDVFSLTLAKDYTAASYAIMADGEIWAADTVGTDGSGNPATVNHTFNVCSISKMFCTSAVMQLADKGLLDLDTPVCSYLPRFTMPDERYRKITVRHLLNHTSGLPGTHWRSFSATHVGAVDNQAYYDEVYEYLSHSMLKSEPGSISAYCNDGFTLAEMVAVEVSGIPFGEYVRDNITEPIGAHSTRASTVNNPEYPLVHEKKKQPEYFYLQGCGGMTTNMSDLCLFGELFLKENAVLSENVKAQMRTPQGTTFIREDLGAQYFGLGWDDVNVIHRDYDLGDHVQYKGGNSFQFTSALIVLPKYNAVIAAAVTHDCKADPFELGLQIFALAMLEKKGVNIYQRWPLIPDEKKAAWDGIYINGFEAARTHFFGNTLTLTKCPSDPKEHAGITAANLHWNGKDFVTADDKLYSFSEVNGETYLLSTYCDRLNVWGTRVTGFSGLSDAWKERIGKRYLCVNISEEDEVAAEMMNGFALFEMPGVPGMLALQFDTREDGDMGTMDCYCVPADDQKAVSPITVSRDTVYPEFFTEDGAEYCRTSTYMYRREDSLPEYKGEAFAEAGGYNTVYRITSQPDKLPDVPEGRRLMLLDKKMLPVYDTLLKPEVYKPVSEGYLCMI